MKIWKDYNLYRLDITTNKLEWLGSSNRLEEVSRWRIENILDDETMQKMGEMVYPPSRYIIIDHYESEKDYNKWEDVEEL